MRKTDLELHREVASVCIGALKFALRPQPFCGASADYYDACRSAHYYESRGWYRRAIEAWGLAFSRDDSVYGQAYAIRGRKRCNRALQDNSESKLIDDTAISGTPIALELEELEDEWY